MKIINLSANATLEASSDDAAPKVSMLAYGGGVIGRVNGFRLPVIIDLDGVQNLGNSMPLFFNHNHERIVGHGVMTRQDNTLTLSGVVSANNADSQQVVALAKAGFPWKSSVGAQVLKTEELKANKSATVNGQVVVGPLLIARQSFVYETSFVTVPADSTTSANVAANGSKIYGDIEMDFAAWLSEKGFVQADLTDSATTALQAMFNAESGDKPTSVDDVLAGARMKEKRQAVYGEIIQAAIDRGMDTDEAEKLVAAAKESNMSEAEFSLQVLRMGRHQATGYQQARIDSPELIEAAIARSTGDRDVLKAYRPEVLEASEKKFRHGLTLVELLTMSARQNGYSGISRRDLSPLLRAAFDIRASGPSTYSVGGILSNVANKMITAGFNSVESEWRKLAAIKPVNDLKEYTSYSLTGDFIYQEVGKQGELTHATLGEVSYGNQAKTYGRMFAITRSDLINDDLGAFSRVRTMLGRGAALKLNIEFWTKFLAGVGSSFWDTAAPMNKLTGAGSALSIDGLSAASNAFSALTDPDGNPLGVTPRLLIVPRALEIEATKLMRDTEIRVNGASTKTTYTTGNPHAGKFELIASSYLNAASIPNGSATHWWLAADPLDLPTIECAFLYGREMPTVESADADFDTLGLQLRGFHDFGVALQEKRASVYCTGA